MSYLNPIVLDSGLSTLTTNADRIDICGTEPTTYAQASSTYTLGNSAVTTGSPGARTPSGRKVTVGAVSSGTVTASGTANYWALTDGSSTLYAVGAITSPQAVTSGNNFTLTAIDIGIPGLA